MNGKEIKIRVSENMYFTLKQIAAIKGTNIPSLTNRMIKDEVDKYLGRVAASLAESNNK